jgi:hypothetical protein
MKGVNHPPEKGIPVKHPMMHRTRTLDNRPGFYYARLVISSRP